MTEEALMRRAIALSAEAVEQGGGPFGAVVCRDGRILGEGRNQVGPGRDPTAHAEVMAIRAACTELGTHDLTGATLYTSCEPCPMCLGAAWWAGIGAIVYGNAGTDLALIGSDDRGLYAEIGRPHQDRRVPIRRLLAAEARAVFEGFAAKRDG